MKSVKSSLLGLDIIILLSKDSDTKHKDRRPWDIVNDDESYESFVRDRLLEWPFRLGIFHYSYKRHIII